MSDSQERFRVRMEGTRPIWLPVAEMTPDDALAAVAFQERELAVMMENAAPGVALLQRIADGDRSMSRRQLRRARETVATLVRVQQQTDRLRAAVRAMLPPAVRSEIGDLATARHRRASQIRRRAPGIGCPHYRRPWAAQLIEGRQCLARCGEAHYWLR